jgi:hypothetical protein
MSERDEINLRHVQQDWQVKQSSSGMMTMALCAAAIGGLAYFVSAPSAQSAGILAVLLVALMVACARVVTCAAKVVEVRTTLQPARVRTEVIDVEVVDSQSYQQQRSFPRYI